MEEADLLKERLQAITVRTAARVTGLLTAIPTNPQRALNLNAVP